MNLKLRATRTQFWLTALVCIAVLAVGNFVVQHLTARTVSRRVLEEARNASSASVIALGNSLIRAGFVPQVFALAQRPLVAKLPAVNLALGASTPVEQLLILREAFRSNSNPRLLIYGFYDFQLTDQVSFLNSDIIGNHDILYYKEPEFARRFFQMPRYDAAAFEITRRFPMLAERGAVWAKVEGLRRFLAQQGMPTQSRNQFGRVADFTLLEASSREEFELHSVQASQAPLNPPVSEIIREARQRGAHAVFVLMPLPPKHVGTFYDTPAWGAYQRHVQQILKVQDVSFLDASRWLPDAAKFGDALHLTEQGAAEFSDHLGAVCSSPQWSNLCSVTKSISPSPPSRTHP